MRPRAASLTALCVAAASLAVAVRWGTFSAGGADSYGYVSQASLWATGRLSVEQPLADLEGEFGPWIFAPLGYRPGRDSGTLVPTYPPGLPLVMAVALKLGGADAVSLVVPIFGACLLLLTFRLGVQVGDPAVGLAATVALATSPVFLCQLFQPMSDVPAAAWWLLATVLAAAATRRTAFGAGVAAAAAVLTRPALLWSVAGVGLLLVASHRRSLLPSGRSSWAARFEALAWFAAGLLPGCAALALLHTELYGAPLQSGYGALAELYAFENVPANLVRYLRWLTETQTLFPLLALAAPVLRGRRLSADHASGAVMAEPARWALLLGVALVWASHLPYGPFEEWWYLRFLLPALPVLLVLASATMVWVVGAAGTRVVPSAILRAVALATIVLGLAAWQLQAARSRGVFGLHVAERRYRDAAASVQDLLPARAVLLSLQHSGSLRHYSGRVTLRWDHVAPTRLDELLDALVHRGLEPYLVVEDWEASLFRKRFAEATAVGRLDWPPVVEVRSSRIVRIYDPRQRAAYFQGASLTPRIVIPPWRLRKRGERRR